MLCTLSLHAFVTYLCGHPLNLQLDARNLGLRVEWKVAVMGLRLRSGCRQVGEFHGTASSPQGEPITGNACAGDQALSLFLSAGLRVTNDPQALGPPDHFWFLSLSLSLFFCRA